MRVYHKQQILELLSTIEEGLDYAINSDDEKATAMLYECFDGLVFLTDFIGEEQGIRKTLQEAIDAIQFVISQGKKNHFFLYYIDTIKKIINDVRATLIHDVKTELEIVFMPYKSSMWDSFESIYNEAKEDPSCICHVVPIPYYEKNEQGEVVKVCYEGSQFPEDIPVTSFETYNFEERRPDIIYIHNPFDAFNRLTMVDPRFFSDNLAKHTNMLVYVPYYVAGSTKTPELSIFPSFKNVTKIVAQSDRSRDVYLANGIESNKILDLGSPKLDAMIASVHKQYDLPSEWKESIKNKKVILFNTGIADLLASDAWFEKIKQVLEFFMDQQQAVLIWRAHPLTEITLTTMRPHLLDRYVEMRDNLTQSESVIMDDSSDIYPAVTLSDAIISDYSSVMLQYIVTGKPVLALLDESMTQPTRYYHSDYLGCYFSYEVSVSQFMEMVVQNKDEKKEDRISRFKQSISNADGTCGKKIHHAIKNEILHREIMIVER